MKTICCFVSLYVALYGLVNADDDPYNMTTQTINYLFNKNRYDRRVRPWIHKKPVNVTVGMTIVNFGQIREKEMDYSIDTFFYQNWSDERLSHEVSKHPIYLAGSDKNLVWMPDTFFLNIKTAKTHMVPADNTKVTVWPSGLVRHSTRLTLTAGCEMNLQDYPLDTQSCNLTILSYSYPESQLDYVWRGDIDKTIDIMNKAMNEFDLIGIQLHREVYQYTIGPWVHLTVTFTFKRRIQYSLLQVYAPTLLIVALSWLSFWIPKEAAPARIALGITTVLTIVTLMGSLRSQFPKVSYVKAVDLFFIVSFIFVFGAVLEYVLLLLKCALDEKKAEERKQKLQRVREMNQDKDTPREITSDDNKNKNCGGEIKEHDQNGLHLKSETRKRHFSSRTMRSTKKIVRFMFLDNQSSIVDRLSRIIFPVGYLLFNIVYWLFYTLNNFQ